MTTVVLSDEGQVSLPANLLRRLGLGAGARLELSEEPDGLWPRVLRARPPTDIANVVSSHDMQELVELRRRRDEATRWYSRYRRKVTEQTDDSESPTLTDSGVNRLVHELR